jgi:hypothetical protein
MSRRIPWEFVGKFTGVAGGRLDAPAGIVSTIDPFGRNAEGESGADDQDGRQDRHAGMAEAARQTCADALKAGPENCTVPELVTILSAPRL